MPQVRLHCPHCGFNTLTNIPLLARRDRPVTCPKCRERFPQHEGLTTTRRPWPKRLKVLAGWLLLPFGYAVLLALLAMTTVLLAVIVPLGLIMILFGWKQPGQSGDVSTGEVLLITPWAPSLLILLLFPLFALYHAAWSFQPAPLLPPAGLLLGIAPDQLVMLHIGLAAFSVVLLLFYLARLVPGKLAQLRELQLMVPAKVRSATMGLVELEGALRIEPPADGKGPPRWFLEDDTGRIPVDPKLHGGEPLPLLNDSIYEVAQELADGDYVYLLGHAHPDPDASPGTLDATRLVVRPVTETLLAGLMKNRSFSRPRPLRENPGVFVLAPGGERRAQRLLRRHLVTSAALSLATIAAAVWMLSVEVPRLQGRADEIAPAEILSKALPADGDIQRREAAQALAKVTGDAERVVPLLAGFLADPDPQVRLAGAEGLLAHGPAAAPAVAQILAALQAETRRVAEWFLKRRSAIGLAR